MLKTENVVKILNLLKTKRVKGKRDMLHNSKPMRKVTTERKERIEGNTNLLTRVS